jgi:hypothetical protein
MAGKFRDDHGVHQSRNDPNEGNMKAFVDHGVSPSNFLLAAPETKYETADGMTLQSVEARLKRQGTSSRSRGEMSHDVV